MLSYILSFLFISHFYFLFVSLHAECDLTLQTLIDRSFIYSFYIIFCCYHSLFSFSIFSNLSVSSVSSFPYVCFTLHCCYYSLLSLVFIFSHPHLIINFWFSLRILISVSMQTFLFIIRRKVSHISVEIFCIVRPLQNTQTRGDALFT